MKTILYGVAVLTGLGLATSALAQSANDVTWTGPYVGVNVGYGGGDFKYGASGTSDSAGANPASERLRQSSSGAIGGGQIGYNHELSNGIVLGVETDIAASDIGAKTSFAASTVRAMRRPATSSRRSIIWALCAAGSARPCSTAASFPTSPAVLPTAA